MEQLIKRQQEADGYGLPGSPSLVQHWPAHDNSYDPARTRLALHTTGVTRDLLFNNHEIDQQAAGRNVPNGCIIFIRYPTLGLFDARFGSQ